MTPDVDLDAARLLVAIDESGSVGAAARRMGVSQPAASARLRAFEGRWRLTMVERSPRGSRLTEDGRAVASWARTVLHEVETMQAGMAALSGRRGGGVTIAASLTVAEFLLPRWLGELHTRRPDVHPHLSVVNSEQVLERVRSGQADVGFIESASRPHDLEARMVGRDELVVVVAPSHPWARRRTPLSPDTLARASYVLREPGSGTRSTFESALRAVPAVTLEASSTTALVGAALAGVGPTVVSRRAVEADLDRGRLVIVPTELDLRRRLTAVWARGRRLGDAAADLLLVAAEASRRSSNRPEPGTD